MMASGLSSGAAAAAAAAISNVGASSGDAGTSSGGAGNSSGGTSTSSGDAGTSSGSVAASSGGAGTSSEGAGTSSGSANASSDGAGTSSGGAGTSSGSANASSDGAGTSSGGAGTSSGSAVASSVGAGTSSGSSGGAGTSSGGAGTSSGSSGGAGTSSGGAGTSSGGAATSSGRAGCSSSSSGGDNNKQWVTDLENQNIDACKRLRYLLMTCADPIETIQNFQERNSIKLPTLNAALHLLDLHNVRRTEFHEEVINDISELLLTKIRELGADGSRDAVHRLEKQLEKCFKLYRVPSIQPLVLETLKQLPKVPDRCAVTVRQQIWLKNDTLFMDAILPVVDSFIDQKRKIMQAVDQSPTNYFTCETTKSRRQLPQIVELMSIVGQHEPLYRRLSGFVRERFLRTADQIYCSLRMELAMSAHDLNIESVIRADPCHDLAWCLDACVRDKHLDGQQTNKLKGILDSTRRTKPEAIGDLAMIAGDAHVIHFVSSMAVKVLRDAALHATGQLPRDLTPLQLLLKLLQFGASAHSILSTNDVNALQNVDTLIFTKFLASFTTMMVEDVIRYELNRAPDEIIDDMLASDYLSDVSEDMISFLKTDITCSLLWIHYVLDIFPSKRRAVDLRGLMRYLKALPLLKDKIAFCDPWMHLIIHRLLQSAPFDNLLASPQAAYFFIEEYLLKGLEYRPGVKYHLLRIVHLSWNTIGDFRCRLILDKITPENVFEPGAIEDEDDVKHYTQEYQRIRAKMTEKTSSGESSESRSPVTSSISDASQNSSK